MMMRYTFFGGFCFLSLLIAGCNTQIAVTGATRERLLHPSPFGIQWIKEGMTKESRRVDSWACGALPTTYAADHSMVTEGANQGGEMDLRLSKQWVVCMKSKGYVYLEKCDSRCLYP